MISFPEKFLNEYNKRDYEFFYHKKSFSYHYSNFVNFYFGNEKELVVKEK
jgi:hypothetical protein